MTAEELNIVDPALSVATELETLFPDAVFTSGRRTSAEQASAMAENVMQNRRWISQTYLPSAISDACQGWVDSNPSRATQLEISAGLESVIESFPEEGWSHLSKHLIGMAFDVQPSNNQNLKAWLYAKALTVGGKFLQREGNLVRWHFEV